MCVLRYGLQSSSPDLGMLRQVLLEMVVIKCDFSDWLGVLRA